MVRIEVSRDRVKEWVRYFNRAYLNPVTLSFSGRRGSIYTMIEHVGRSSGKRYATPVLAMRHGDGFIIPLPYGTHVDWCKNILAAGGCTVAWQGQAYRVREPRILTPEEGLSAFPVWIQRFLNMAGTQAYLGLKLAPAAPEDPEAYARLIAEHPGTDAWRGVLPALFLLAACVTLLWLATRRCARKGT